MITEGIYHNPFDSRLRIPFLLMLMLLLLIDLF